ncbi:MAG: hypothetical protein ABIO70_24590 [Pseudomonadota bacterium]
MNDLGPWFNLTKAHLSLHWQKHLPPMLITLAPALALGFLLVPVFLLGGVLSSVLGSLTHSGAVAGVVSLVVFGIGGLVFLAVIIATTFLFWGYLRVVLKLHRSEPTDRSDLLWGFRHPGLVIGVGLVQVALSLPAVMLCYFPVFLVAAALFFTRLVAVDRELGPIDCAKASWALVKPRFFEILVVMFILTFGMVFLAYIPLVGTFLGWMVYTSAMVVIYDDLVQREHFSV